MGFYNKVILIGNLTRDPEVRYTPKGTAVAKLGLAINRNWRTETGEQREEVTFVDVDVFGRQAETVGQYLRKGRPVLVEGRLRLDTWEDKQTNQKRSRLGVVMESFQFLDYGGGRGGEGEPGGPARASRSTGSAPAAAAPAAAPDVADAEPAGEDEVPF
jgi:single-strand DNA-binding protein